MKKQHRIFAMLMACFLGVSALYGGGTLTFATSNKSDDIVISEDSSTDDIIMESSEINEESSSEEDITIIQESESDSNEIIIEDETLENVTENSSDTNDEIVISKEETESNPSQEIILEEESKENFASVFLGDNVDVHTTLNASDFASMRLLVEITDDTLVPVQEQIVGQYENLYLLEFTSIQQTMNAYVHFKNHGCFVEPDMPVTSAGTDDIVITPENEMTREENPLTKLSAVSVTDMNITENHVIALIDTAVLDHENVIDKISVLPIKSEQNSSHGDKMVEAIVGQNPDAKLLSIEALNENGTGTVSSLVAAIEYAIDAKVDMINLSCYARSMLSTSVLKSEIQKAVDAGIIVIGAAGNDGGDVIDYIPGSVESAYIIGAAKEDGSRLEISNFGTTVDYHVVAESTSEATALFTGYVSKDGLDKVSEVLNQGLIFETGYTYIREPIEDTGEVFPVEFSVDGNIKFVFSNLDGSLVKTVELSNESKIVDIPMTGVHVDVIADKTEMLTDISVVGTNEEVLTDVNIPTNIFSWMKGVRNTFFTLDEMQGMKISVTSKQMNEEMPMFDEIAQTTYFESVLCDENCLEEHVRKVGPDDGVEVPTNQLGEDEVMAASGIPVGSGGLCEIWFVARPGGSWQNSGSFNVQFHDGDLAGNYVTGFTCLNHGKANPGHGGNPAVPMIYGDYTVQSSQDNQNGTVTYYITVHVHDGNGHSSEMMGYQNIAGYIMISNPKGGLSVWKHTGNRSVTDNNANYSLVGAKFKVYKEDGTYVQTIQTDRTEWFEGWEYGVASTADDALDAGRYYVEEIKASPGYQVNPQRAYIDVKAGQNHRANWTYFSEPPLLGKLEITKQSANPSITNNNSAYFLAGAEFKVCRDRACNSVYATITTDTNGKALLSNIPLGTYYLYESKPPKGFAGKSQGEYWHKSNPAVATITKDNATSTLRFSLTNQPKSGEGELFKKSDNPSMTDNNNCYSLAGAEYGVWTNSNCTGNPIQKMVTDSNGYAKVSSLAFGTYYVKEIKASKGFDLDKKIYTITISESARKAQIHSVEPSQNDPMVISITKLHEGDETDTIPSLAGTQFTVWYYDNLNKDVSGTPKKTWVLEVKQVGGKWICMLKDKYLVKEKSDDFYRDPDTNDPVLPYGTYKIQETQHAPGYTFNGGFTNADGTVSLSAKDPYITVVDKNTTGGANLVGGNEYSATNKTVPMSITLKKFGDGKQSLAGVTFKIQSKSGYAETQPDFQSELTTGPDGTVKWTKLHPDIYTITEIKTVDGYSLLQDPIEIKVPYRMTKEEANRQNLVDPNPKDDLDGVIWDEKTQTYYVTDLVFDITNDITFAVPSTGGTFSWTMLLSLGIGVGLWTVLAWFYARRKSV